MRKSEIRKSKEIIRLLPKDKTLKILDVGCGYGEVTNYLFEDGYRNIEGFDLNSNKINKAKEDYPKINFWISDAFDIDYSKYDVIYAWGSFYYMEDVKKLLMKINKEMKDGSLLIFSTPNVCSLNKRIKSFFGISPINEKVYPVLPLTFKRARKLIESLDFKNKEIISYHNDGRLDFMPIKNLSSHIIIKLEKGTSIVCNR